MNQRIIISIFLTVLLIIGIGARIVAQSVNTDRDGIAVKGYDVVAYFTLGEPTEGSPEFSVEYEGATYYFVNSRHRELFLEDPERYVPQYGGYCAYAVSYGGTASIKPDLWTIYEDRLFLNFSNRTHRRFEADLANLVNSADPNWPEIQRDLEN